jgi:predicted RNA binding protein YcfA (HicA-like mRNA interferase family)
LPPLPVVSGEEAIAALERFGYRRGRQKGSHVRLKADGRQPVTVPLHRELKAGTLRSIIRTAGVSVEEFTAALDR